jgi:hypothetical protein
MVYLLLAGCLFPELGYPGVWCELTAGLAGSRAAAPTAGALAPARRRVGPEPLRFLFDLLLMVPVLCVPKISSTDLVLAQDHPQTA